MSGSDSQLEDLRQAVERLAEQVQVLTAAVDDLTTEVQWQNRELRAGERPQPFVLTSMPADPCAEDWRINRVDPETVDELRRQAAGDGGPSAQGRLF